jgi:general secretion pathway protein C
MRLALDRGRLLGSARSVSGWTLLEAGLLALIALQCARLFWTFLTPLGPVGDWRPGSERAAASPEILGGFDPFFRLAGEAGPVAVTSLNLKLFGIRQDQASGRGSAIIAGSDGVQKSVGVGEEIEPGVLLKSVEYDGVTIERGGATERLFMDQGNAGVPGAAPAPGAPPSAPASNAPPAATVPFVPPKSSVEPGGPPVPPSKINQGVSLQPRGSGGQLTGVTVSPRGGGEAFRALGLAPGDVVTSVNGRRIRSADQLSTMAAQLGARGAVVQVERDGRMVTLRPGAGR